WSYWPKVLRRRLDLAFLVPLMLPAPLAVLGELELLLALPTVLGRGVVALGAGGALERDDGSVALGHGDPRPSTASAGRPDFSRPSPGAPREGCRMSQP